MVLDPPRDEAVRLIHNAYVETRSIRSVCQLLKGKGLVTREGNPVKDAMVWHILNNPTYAGKVCHKDKTYPGTPSPIN